MKILGTNQSFVVFLTLLVRSSLAIRLSDLLGGGSCFLLCFDVCQESRGNIPRFATARIGIVEALWRFVTFQSVGACDCETLCSDEIACQCEEAETETSAAWKECAFELCATGNTCPQACLDQFVLAQDTSTFGELELKGPNGEQVYINQNELDMTVATVTLVNPPYNQLQLSLYYDSETIVAYTDEDGNYCQIVYRDNSLEPETITCSPVTETPPQSGGGRQLADLQCTPPSYCDLCASNRDDEACLAAGLIPYPPARIAATIVCGGIVVACSDDTNCDPSNWFQCGEQCYSGTQVRECCGGKNPIFFNTASQELRCCGESILRPDDCCAEDGEKECEGECIPISECCDCDESQVCCQIGDNGLCVTDFCCPNERDADDCCPGKNCGGFCLTPFGPADACCISGAFQVPYRSLFQKCCENPLSPHRPVRDRDECCWRTCFRLNPDQCQSCPTYEFFCIEEGCCPGDRETPDGGCT